MEWDSLSVFRKADRAEESIEKFYVGVMEELNCKREGVETSSVLMKAKKDTLATWIEHLMDTTIRYNREVVRGLRTEVDELRTKTLQAQARVVELQEELLEVKSDQLASVKTTVQASVEEGIKSYSSALGDSISAQFPLPQRAIRKVVEDVFHAEDRGRNLIVFGLEEDTEEDLEEKLGEVFLELGEKPNVEAIRLGTRAADASRPVKVTTSSSTCVNQILRKRTALKDSEKHNKVFIAPDRTPKEREERRKLVVELKKRSSDDPQRRHFIRQGEVCSSAKD